MRKRKKTGGGGIKVPNSSSQSKERRTGAGKSTLQLYFGGGNEHNERKGYSKEEMATLGEGVEKYRKKILPGLGRRGPSKRGKAEYFKRTHPP